jgi:hypothetical protein
MRRLLAAWLLTVATAAAQEGFPLDGTWRGEREDARKSPVTIVMIMQWDGAAVTGVINPGPKAIPIESAKLIPNGWRVTVAARTPAGEPIAFEGVLTELGSYNRSIDGTWTEGGRSYRVRMVRE